MEKYAKYKFDSRNEYFSVELYLDKEHDKPLERNPNRPHA